MLLLLYVYKMIAHSTADVAQWYHHSSHRLLGYILDPLEHLKAFANSLLFTKLPSTLHANKQTQTQNKHKHQHNINGTTQTNNNNTNTTKSAEFMKYSYNFSYNTIFFSFIPNWSWTVMIWIYRRFQSIIAEWFTPQLCIENCNS